MPDNTDKYNEIKTDGDILIMVITKPITQEGYNDNFLPAFKDFQGWEQEASFDDLKSIAEYGKYLTKYAFINPPSKEVFKAQLSKDMLPGEMRIFTEDQYDEAMAWLKE